jgi:hypothetical protein
MKRIVLLLMVFPLILTGCAFWKSTSLNSKRFGFIQNGSKPDQVLIKTDEYGLEDLSVGISISKGMICVADNELHRVQVMKPNGDIQLIVGNVKNLKTKDITAENFNFGTIGYVVRDDDDNVYIQNKLARGKESGKEKDSAVDSIDVLSSFILVFSKSGELQYTLGQKGTPDTPFSHIERLYVDSKDRLFVITRSIESWSVFRFKGKNRDYFMNLGNLNLKDREEGNVYDGKIDNVKIYSSGDKILISVSYYHGTRLKYIKIFEYSILEGKISKTIMMIPDPKNVLFDIIDDKYVYLWNVSNDEVKYEVANLDGTIINNVYLKMEHKRNYYSRIILDDSGKLYSYNILKSGVEILKWE